MLSAVVIALVVGVVVAQDTTTAHMTHAHVTHVHVTHTRPTLAPHETHAFQYFSTVHQLVLKTAHNCYVMTLSASQQTEVHSPTGLHSLESQLLLAVDANTSPLDASKVDSHVAHFCMVGLKHLPVIAVN